MVVLIVSVGIMFALVLTLSVMNRRERREQPAVGARPWLSVSTTLG